MSYRTAASIPGEQEISQRIRAAEYEYKVAKKELDGFLHALHNCSDGIAGMEGNPIVRQLAEREQSALSGVAEALQTLFEHNQRSEKRGMQSALCA